ncbi:hypothetical protein C0J52_17474 [Blattella germanica]|nr:hypothetical protein C0J52_17474 [Blattella germanica]
MPRRRRPDIGRRSRTNARKHASRAKRTHDQRERDKEKNRIHMSKYRSRVNKNEEDRLRMQRIRAYQKQKQRARHNAIERSRRRSAPSNMATLSNEKSKEEEYNADKNGETTVGMIILDPLDIKEDALDPKASTLQLSALIDTGFSATEAGRRLGIPRTTAQGWACRYCNFGELGRRPGSGRLRVSTREQDEAAELFWRTLPALLDGDNAFEMKYVTNEETTFESIENGTCIKQEIPGADGNYVNLAENPTSSNKDMVIKDEVISEEVNPNCNISDYEDISNETLTENASKRSSFHFSTDCTKGLQTKKPKQKNVCEMDKLMQSAMDGLQILQNHLNRPNYDDIDAFMHYIAAELRELKNPLNLMEAKQSISNVVYELRKRDIE